MFTERMPTDTVENVRDYLAVDPRRRVVLALDHINIKDMLFVDSEVISSVGAVKIGNELHSRHGWAAISRFLTAKRAVQGVYYDARFSDNPDQTAALMDVFNSTRRDDSIQPGIVSLDVLGASDEALRRAVANRGKFLLITETVQPSLDQGDCFRRHRRSIAEVVYDAAQIAEETGLHGTTSSVEGLKLMAEDPALGGLIRVVSGIRVSGDTLGDQKLVCNPGDAVRSGAEMLVIGRSILEAPNGDQIGRLNQIANEIQAAL